MKPLSILFARLMNLSGNACASSQADIDRAYLSAQELQSIPDADVEYRLYSRLVDVIHADNKGELLRFSQLSNGQQALYATWHVEGEVNNGGFNQYFFNSDGAFAAAAIRGYELFGDPDLAGLVREADRRFRKDRERIRSVRADGSIEAFMGSYDTQPYDDLDQRFCKRTPPGAQRIEYIRSHNSEFAR